MEYQLYTWSAADRESLLRELPTDPDGPCRLALVAANQDELDHKLALAARRLRENPSPRWRHRSGIFFADLNEQPGGAPVAFLFPGQGSEYEGMLRDGPACVQDWLHELEEVWGEPIAWPVGVDLGGMLTTVSGLALAEALGELGVQAQAMAGPSSGENAALMAAGAMRFGSRRELFELLRGLFEHGQGIEQAGRAPEADFLAVSVEDRGLVQEALDRFPGELWIALDNCPRQLVLAGSGPAVAQVEARLAQGGAFSFRLPFRRAFHTPLYQAVSRSLAEEVYPRLQLAAPQVPVYSCARAEPFPEDPEAIRSLAAEQWASTVRFRETLLRMHRDGIRHFLEVGPGGRLAGFVRDTLRNQPHSAWTTAAEGRSERLQLLEIAAFLYCEGPVAEPATVTSSTPLLTGARRLDDRLEANLVLDPEKHRFLLDHRLGRLPVLPFSFSLELAAEAAVQLVGGVPIEVREAHGSRWLAVENESLQLRVLARRLDANTVSVRLLEGELVAFSCEVEMAPHYPEAPAPLPDLPGTPLPIQLSAQAYNTSLFHGEGLLSLWQARAATSGGIEVEVRVPHGHHEPWVLAADTLDGAGHLAAYWLLQQGKRRFWLFPVAVARLSLFGPPPPPHSMLTCRLIVRDSHHADMDWLDGNGRPVMRFEGFRFVWDTYPLTVYDWLHYPERGRLLSEPTEEGRCLKLPEGYLESSGGIWRRALACRALTGRERKAGGWPLAAWIAGKEAVQEWARERGVRLELDQFELLPDSQGRPRLHGAAWLEGLELSIQEDRVRVEPARGLVQSS